MLKKSIIVMIYIMVCMSALAACASKSRDEEISLTMSITPDLEPTAEPVVEPTAAPTIEPTIGPTVKPTGEPKELSTSDDFFKIISFDSMAISYNLIDEETEQSIAVYLPPSYYESDKSYPVVYYLHGFGEQSGTAYLERNRAVLDSIFTGTEREFIMVGCDGCNSLQGSFFTNSPVIGNWEDHITKEVVNYIDTNYRTIANAESRGICGLSMGGMGAINIALLHPDIYGAVYAMSPAIMQDDKLVGHIAGWNVVNNFVLAYACAFAPITGEPYGVAPVMDGSAEDNAIIELWQKGFGNWEKKLDAYLALDTPLRSIGFSYGTISDIPYLVEGTQYLSDLMVEKGINNSLFTFPGGHSYPPDSISEHIIPFFTEGLVW